MDAAVELVPVSGIVSTAAVALIGKPSRCGFGRNGLGLVDLGCMGFPDTGGA